MSTQTSNITKLKKQVSDMDIKTQKKLCDILRIYEKDLNDYIEKNHDIDVKNILYDKNIIKPDNKAYWCNYKVDEIKWHCDRLGFKYPTTNKGTEYKSKSTLIRALIKNIKNSKTETKSSPQISIPTTSNSIISCANACHNILRDNDAIAGEKAMEDIMRLLFIKFLEPMIESKQLDIENPDYYKDDLRYKSGMEKLCRFSYLYKKSTTDEDALKNLEKLWKVIFSKYSLTKELFLPKSFFNCGKKKDNTTLLQLLEKINNIGSDFDKLQNDVKGDLYEEFLNGYASQGGKDFGQYFTSRGMVNMIFDNLPECDFIKDKLSEFKALDPFMGTAGFLTEIYKRYSKSTIHGSEIVAKTWNLAIMNIILTTGKLDKNSIKCKNAITRCSPNTKYDLIMTNPPFGTKMDYTRLEIKYKYKNIAFEDVYPVKNNKGVVLSLQMISHKLAPNGIAAVVFPDGAELYSRMYTKFRKYMMTQCQVVKIISVKGKAFKFAGVSTVIIYLRKLDKDEKENHEIKFYETDSKEMGKIKHVSDVIADKEHNYAWNAKEYVEQVIPTWEGCEWKELGEVCEFKKGKLSSTKTETGKGHGVFITVASEEKWKKIEPDLNGECLLLSNVSSGKVWPLHYYKGSYSYCNLLINITPKDLDICLRYLFYILKNEVIKKINDFISGAANKSINMTKLSKLKIPVPSLEIQKKIVSKLNVINESKQKALDYIKSIKETIEIYRTHVQPPFSDYKKDIKYMKLGDVCDIKSGVFISKTQLKNGKYPVIGGGKIMGYHNIKNESGNKIVIPRVGDTKVSFIKKDFYLTDNAFSINNKTNSNDYVYFFLKSDIRILKLYKGAAQKVISKTSLQNLKIPIASLNTQKIFVEFYENKENKIKEFKKLIETQKKYIEDLNDLGKAVIQNIIISN